MDRIIACIFAIYLILLAAYFIFGQQMIEADQLASKYVFEAMKPLYITFLILTNAGSGAFLLIVSAWIFFKKSREAGAMLFLALWFDFFINLVLKDFFTRPRPEWFETKMFDIDSWLYSFSFPSGHASRIALTTSLLYNFFSKQRILMIVAAALVVFSRVVIGAHFWLDVIVGALNGILIARLWMAIPWIEIKKRIIKNDKKS